MEYLQHTYYTFTGTIKYIDLGDFVYGEWIVYQNGAPKYHINVSRGNSKSDEIILNLIESKKETIESIIAKINTQPNVQLTLDNRPLARWQKKSEKINSELAPLPVDWVKNLSSCSF